LPSSNVRKNKKIYISRKNFTDRNNPQESLLEEYFYNKQYKIVYLEKMNFYDQVKLVQESEKIVCIFGSALVNCMLGSEFNNVISIRPSSFQATFYKHIFDMYNINYTEIVYDGESVLDLVKNNENLW
jgi:capsular polysaccharide biosynthesis protein